MPKTATPKPKKPNKPYAGFPLCAHPNGRWCKKVRGKIIYFARWNNGDDPDGLLSLAAWQTERDDIYAGRPRKANGDPTVADMLNAYLSHKIEARDRNEITPRHYLECQRVCDRIAEGLGKHKMLADVNGHNLDSLKSHLSRGKRGALLSPKTVSKDLGIARSIFLFANDYLIDRPVRYRKPLASPSRRMIRQAANEVGPRMFAAGEIRSIIAVADTTMRACVYLGINCAFGPRDCALLPVDRVDLDGGWHTYGRRKTGIARRCKLWPETVDALRAVVADDRDTVFDLPPDSRNLLANEFRRLLTGLGLYRKNVTTFYSLRRTFETVAQASGDQSAVDLVMGHASNNMAAVYRQRVYDAQLVRVSEHVRGWLAGTINID